MSESIVRVSANYHVRVTRTTLTVVGFTLLCKPNPSRWAIRIVNGANSQILITPFPGDPSYGGIGLNESADWHTYLSRDPVLTGLSWYAYMANLLAPPPTVEVWETTPVGT